jgi:hypothetical protein
MSENGHRAGVVRGAETVQAKITIRLFANGHMQIDYPANPAIALWMLELAKDEVKAKAKPPSVIDRV